MICNPPIHKALVQAWLLRIANPQIIKRLGHFLTPDCKSGGTPGGGLSVFAWRKTFAERTATIHKLERFN